MTMMQRRRALMAVQNGGGNYWGALTALLKDELEDVPALDGVTEYKPYQFAYHSNLKTVDFTNITKIGNNVFSNSGITHAVIPNNVVTANGATFDGARQLESLIVKGAMDITGYAVRDCKNLTIIDTTIRTNAGIDVSTMSRTTALKTIIIRNSDAIRKANGSFPATCGMLDGGKIYVPAALKAAYIANSTWAQYADMFESIEGSYYETHYGNGDPIPTGG